MLISDTTTEQLIDLLELVIAGSTAPTLVSRAAAILPHLKYTGDVPDTCAHGISTDDPCPDCPPDAIEAEDGRIIAL
jgi:hypothetical protein